MCGSTKAPKVVQQDPVADQAKADAAATQEANAALAQRRKTMARNSLLTLGPWGTDTPTRAPAALLSLPDDGSASTTTPKLRQSNPKLLALGDTTRSTLG